jgi:hypothetical protein
MEPNTSTRQMLLLMDKLVDFVNALQETEDEDEISNLEDLRDRLGEALESLEFVVPSARPKKKRKTVSSSVNSWHSPTQALEQKAQSDLSKRFESLSAEVSGHPPAPPTVVVTLVQGTHNHQLPKDQRLEDAALRRVIVGYEWSDSINWVSSRSRGDNRATFTILML